MQKSFTNRRGQADNVMTLARVADLGSFRAAARELGISVSAVSQTIRALEVRAQVPLLNRTTRAVVLTDAGKRFLDRAQPAALELLHAFDSARLENEGATGLLRLNVPRVYGPRLIGPLLAEFIALHPKLEVEVFAEDTRSNVIAEGFDAGVRLGESVDRDMIALRMTQPFNWVIVGAPAYFSRFGRPARLEDLARHRCVRFRKRPREAIQPWTLARGSRRGPIAVSGPLVVNDAASAVTAALSAIGLVYLPYPIVEPHVRNGDLESVLGGVGLQSDGAWLYYPRRRQALPRLRAFIDFVQLRSRPA